MQPLNKIYSGTPLSSTHEVETFAGETSDVLVTFFEKGYKIELGSTGLMAELTPDRVKVLTLQGYQSLSEVENARSKLMELLKSAATINLDQEGVLWVQP